MKDILKENTKNIKEIVESLSFDDYPHYINELLNSEKKTVRDIAVSMSKKLDKFEKEKLRIQKMYEYEENIKKSYHIENILCLDEVGRGPLAGPVVICGVMLKQNPDILYVNDSKKLSEEKRKEIYNEVLKQKIDYKIELLDNSKIDELNIFNATYMAMANVVKKFDKEINHILIDGNQIIKQVNIDQTAVIKGDTKVLGIALSSIIAKVVRDDIMVEYDKIYPQYYFAKNKGYGTSEHIDAIKKYGPCPIHRRSFLKNII